jgi:tetratricopeptide (TPR) repeat protein
MRGHLREGRERTERVLGLPNASAHPSAYLRALEAAGGVTYWMGDMPATETHYTKRLELARATGDGMKIANALYDLSFVYVLPATDLDRGRDLLEEALALFQKAGDRGAIAKTLWALSANYVGHQEWERAIAIVPDVIATFRALGNRFGLGWALHNLGIVSVRVGRFSDARTAFTESIGIFASSNDLSGVVLLLNDFAELAAAQGHEDRALRLIGAARPIQQQTGNALADVWRDENTAYALEIRALLARVDDRRRDVIFAEGATLSREDAIAFALSERDAP